MSGNRNCDHKAPFSVEVGRRGVLKSGVWERDATLFLRKDDFLDDFMLTTGRVRFNTERGVNSLQ